jgi:hypothetical protein
MGKYEGKSSVGLRPKTSEQVSKILSHCNSRKLAVVPQVCQQNAKCSFTAMHFCFVGALLGMQEGFDKMVSCREGTLAW